MKNTFVTITSATILIAALSVNSYAGISRSAGSCGRNAFGGAHSHAGSMGVARGNANIGRASRTGSMGTNSVRSYTKTVTINGNAYTVSGDITKTDSDHYTSTNTLTNKTTGKTIYTGTATTATSKNADGSTSVYRVSSGKNANNEPAHTGEILTGSYNQDPSIPSFYHYGLTSGKTYTHEGSSSKGIGAPSEHKTFNVSHLGSIKSQDTGKVHEGELAVELGYGSPTTGSKYIFAHVGTTTVKNVTYSAFTTVQKNSDGSITITSDPTIENSYSYQ